MPTHVKLLQRIGCFFTVITQVSYVCTFETIYDIIFYFCKCKHKIRYVSLNVFYFSLEVNLCKRFLFVFFACHAVEYFVLQYILYAAYTRYTVVVYSVVVILNVDKRQHLYHGTTKMYSHYYYTGN